MQEYTIIAVISVLAAVLLDRLSGIGILRKKEYYIFLPVILFFKLLVNGYLTGYEVVIYNSKYFMGIRLGSIPVEDFLFGFSMITMSVIFWEYFKDKAT
jgi:lycopene cyclase domain-containing protein